MDSTILILGVGFMGACLAEDLRASGRRVLLHHRRPEVHHAAAAAGLGEAVDDLEAVLSVVDVAVVCTPVGVIPQQVQRLTAGPGPVCTDIGSTKADICAALAQESASGRFVGSHPMTGSHLHGWEHHRAGLFRDATCVLTPLPETPQHAIDRIDELWRSVGGITHRYTPSDHDQAVAEISHLPHILASACADALTDRGLPLAAGGFRDTSRKAAGHPGMWRDILMSNRTAVGDQLSASISHLQALATAVEKGDSAAIEAWLERGRQRRLRFEQRQTDSRES